MPLRKDGTYYRVTSEDSAPAPAPAPAPTPTTTPTTPAYTPPAGTPSWYAAKPTTNLVDTFANALLPYMSPEDMRKVSGNLAENPTYAGYKNASDFPSAPAEITPQIKANYLSSERASNALTALGQMATLTGKQEADLGPGYSYLKEVLGTMQRLGGQNGQPMSRSQYQEFYTALQGFKQRAQDNYDLAPYASLADYITNPTFSSGSLVNTGRDPVTGKLYYAKQNKRLFG